MGLNQAQSNMVNYATYLQNQALQDTNQRFNYALEALKTLGTSAKTDVGIAQKEADATNTQQMISAGMGNTTVPATLRMGTADTAARAGQRIDEGVADRLISLLGSKQVNAPTNSDIFNMLKGMSSATQTTPQYNVSYSGFYGPSFY
jgi:hypothetical protein